MATPSLTLSMFQLSAFPLTYRVLLLAQQQAQLQA
jgi:hypothetical protein